jgi:hypothetical protein
MKSKNNNKEYAKEILSFIAEYNKGIDYLVGYGLNSSERLMKILPEDTALFNTALAILGVHTKNAALREACFIEFYDNNYNVDRFLKILKTTMRKTRG